MSVLLETTVGDIVIDLYTEYAPNTSKNFLKLCKVKYYNFSPVYNLQKDFSFQTGDPLGPDGDGGTSIWGLLGGPRFFPAEIHPKLKHKERGTVSMVTAGKENGNINAGFSGSQFFITLGDNLDYLNGKYTIFGKVAEGFDTLETINNAYCDSNMHDDRPFKDIRIKHTIILDDPFPDPEGLVEPEKSPLPSKEQLATVRIGNDEKFDEDMDEAEAEKLRREREAKAQALTLEMIGDLPFAEVKPPDHVLFVCKLNSATRDEDLELIFSRFGKIISCEIIRDRRTGDSLQYAFIEFEKKEDCEQAYFKMQDVLIDDKRIKVDFSQSVSKLSDSWRMETNWKRKNAVQKSFAGSTYLEKGKAYQEYRNDDYSMIITIKVNMTENTRPIGTLKEILIEIILIVTIGIKVEAEVGIEVKIEVEIEV
ncbi:unnamed protein product [Pneumocystis jirovecii]|uniref:Peptidyl-prolyl cis-trans isomerase n=1 Tax=Pneumocystis jirovecii TaxID=42068 RepID=L0PFP6_PNEJI|nr:unnamed protein product [Pneumocystis jirovecii]